MEATTVPVLVKLEAKGLGVYEAGILFDEIWNKNMVQDKFIWVCKPAAGSTVSIGAWANNTGLTLKIYADDAVVKELAVKPKAYGLLELTI